MPPTDKTVCDNLGYVTVYRLSDALSSNSRKTNLHPHYYFKASDYSIYSIITHDDFLICGGENMISGWLWSDIISKVPSFLTCALSSADNINLIIIL
ncbi:THOC6 [Bugula neritina]|uniref:THOC6 n=1 Tax=Bugula neritina TaxID=10212 RepID=A0A7J7K7R9_BUGNE|nr:THOC6 [Bugula neritina]